jgi:hypothetical protein
MLWPFSKKKRDLIKLSEILSKLIELPLEISLFRYGLLFQDCGDDLRLNFYYFRSGIIDEVIFQNQNNSSIEIIKGAITLPVFNEFGDDGVSLFLKNKDKEVNVERYKLGREYANLTLRNYNALLPILKFLSLYKTESIVKKSIFFTLDFIEEIMAKEIALFESGIYGNHNISISNLNQIQSVQFYLFRHGFIEKISLYLKDKDASEFVCWTSELMFFLQWNERGILLFNESKNKQSLLAKINQGKEYAEIIYNLTHGDKTREPDFFIFEKIFDIRNS